MPSSGPSVQHRVPAAPVGRGGLLEHIRIEHGNGIEGDAMPVVMGDAPQIGADQLDAGDRAVIERLPEIGDRGLDNVELGHGVR